MGFKIKDSLQKKTEKVLSLVGKMMEYIVHF